MEILTEIWYFLGSFEECANTSITLVANGSYPWISSLEGVASDCYYLNINNICLCILYVYVFMYFHFQFITILMISWLVTYYADIRAQLRRDVTSHDGIKIVVSLCADEIKALDANLKHFCVPRSLEDVYEYMIHGNRMEHVIDEYDNVCSCGVQLD
jgi:hypothetical protein